MLTLVVPSLEIGTDVVRRKQERGTTSVSVSLVNFEQQEREDSRKRWIAGKGG